MTNKQNGNQRVGTGEIDRKERKVRKKIPSGIPDVGATGWSPSLPHAAMQFKCNS